MIAVFKIGLLTAQYWRILIGYIFLGKRYNSHDNIIQDDVWANVQLYSLALIFKMWDKPHYRSKSFQEDMINNLRNVAVPGSGISLSVFCYSKWVCMLFIFFVNPLICLLGAVNKCNKDGLGFLEYVETCYIYYHQHLLHPDDWFSFWRLNCRLTSLQSLVSKSQGFNYENKWNFLMEGRKVGIPVSPFLDIPELVCKHMNIEGGMGIYFYKNALNGGDWIIQERLANANWLNKMLPNSAPLSTMRIITSSDWALYHRSSSDTSGHKADEFVKPLTSVLRLGRAGAATDHSSVLFDVDMSTGVIKKGLTNAHWYKLGVKSITTCPWLPPKLMYDKHPDPPYPMVLGEKVPGIKEALDICVRSHFKLMPDVPMVGWDVAFTATGIYLLEVNLSCNFFKGTFDVPSYIAFVDKFWSNLDKLELDKDDNEKKCT